MRRSVIRSQVNTACLFAVLISLVIGHEPRIGLYLCCVGESVYRCGHSHVTSGDDSVGKSLAVLAYFNALAALFM